MSKYEEHALESKLGRGCAEQRSGARCDTVRHDLARSIAFVRRTRSPVESMAAI